MSLQRRLNFSCCYRGTEYISTVSENSMSVVFLGVYFHGTTAK